MIRKTFDEIAGMWKQMIVDTKTWQVLSWQCLIQSSSSRSTLHVLTMQHQYMFLVVSDSSLGPAFPNYCCYSTTPTDNVDSPLDLLRIKQGLPFQLVDVKVIIGKNIRKFEKLQLSNHPLSCLSHRKFFFVYFSANSMFWGCSLHFLCVLCSLYLIFVTFKLKQFFHRII